MSLLWSDAGTQAPAVTTMSTARQVVVHGDVQGVFFRESCRREAEAAGLTGWVCNHADGTVRAHFEGPAEAVRRLVDWARRGPSAAVVERVDERDVAAEGGSTFDVR
jgi:acylphosphatase